MHNAVLEDGNFLLQQAQVLKVNLLEKIVSMAALNGLIADILTIVATQKPTVISKPALILVNVRLRSMVLDHKNQETDVDLIDGPHAGILSNVVT